MYGSLHHTALLLLVLDTAVVTNSQAAFILTVSPTTGRDGDLVRLSCKDRDEAVLGSVAWYRNNVQVFSTNINVSIFDFDKNNQHYHNVAGRFNVSVSFKVHELNLKLNSTLDDGSVWGCSAYIPKRSSNMLKFVLNDTTSVISIQAEDTSTVSWIPTTQRATTEVPNTVVSIQTACTSMVSRIPSAQPATTEVTTTDTESAMTYTVVGASLGSSLVVITAIAACVCLVRRNRKTKRQNHPQCEDVEKTEMPTPDVVSVMETNEMYVGYISPTKESIQGSQFTKETEPECMYAKPIKIRNGVFDETDPQSSGQCNQENVKMERDFLYAKPHKQY